MNRDTHCREAGLSVRAMDGQSLGLVKPVVKGTGVLAAKVEPAVLVSLLAMSAAAGDYRSLSRNIIFNPIIFHWFRVSFHSVKDSSSAGGQTATSSDHDHHGQHHHHHHHRHHFHHSNDDDDTNDKEEKDLTSSSLPTPPPPPLQEQTTT